nr:putative gamma-glutamylcyclotransferase CG2811 isoform X1 [Helicoverpa armigera]
MFTFSLLCAPRAVRLHTIRTIMHKVFVYGTLKRDEPNHYWLTDENNGVGNFLTDGHTKTQYPLIIATKYNIPFLLFSPGDGHLVKGEIYEVDDNMLHKLDMLEDHPNYYVREKDKIVISTQVSEDTETETTVQCWVYFLKNFKPELLDRPHLESYSSKGPHGLPYMDRSKRDPLYNHKSEIKPDIQPVDNPDNKKPDTDPAP